MEFDITLTQLGDLLEKQNFMCSKTGVPLVIAGVDSPWSPSIDRIDNSKGYIDGNIQIVCVMYNRAKHTASDREVLQFAHALLNHSGTPSLEEASNT